MRLEMRKDMANGVFYLYANGRRAAIVDKGRDQALQRAIDAFESEAGGLKADLDDARSEIVGLKAQIALLELEDEVTPPSKPPVPAEPAVVPPSPKAEAPPKPKKTPKKTKTEE